MNKTNYFNRNLKFIRQSKKLSQQEIADKLNIDRSSISRWENGDMEATISNAILLSKYFNISLNDFIFKDLAAENNVSNLFSKNLKYLREKRNLSKNKLSELIGVNQTTIGRWESKEITPSIDNAESVAKIFNISISDLLTKDLSH